MPSTTSEFDEAYDDAEREPTALSAELLEQPIRLLEPRAAVFVTTSTSVADAVAALNDRSAGCLLVTTDGKLVGVFTDRDVVRRVLPAGIALSQARVGDYMTTGPEVLSLDDPIAFALNRMSSGDLRHVPLVDEARHPVAVVSIRDVFRLLVQHFAGSVQNLPPTPSNRSSQYPPYGAA